MPVDLSIKQVPDETADRLRERAERNHRSLQGGPRAILEDAVSQPDRHLDARGLYERAKARGRVGTGGSIVESIKRMPRALGVELVTLDRKLAAAARAYS